MVRLASRSFLLSIALGCATGCGGSPREQDLGLSRAAIVGGATDFDDAAVVYVLILSGDAGASLGTGTVVSPHVVLTAAHVVDRYLGDPAGSFRVFIGVDRRATGSNPDNWLSVREAHADPGFNARFMGSGHDVGVLILDAPTVIPPKPINRAPVDMTWVGKSMRIVGYGITSSDDINATTSGLRREATTSIQSRGVSPWLIPRSNKSTWSGTCANRGSSASFRISRRATSASRRSTTTPVRSAASIRAWRSASRKRIGRAWPAPSFPLLCASDIGWPLF